MLTLETETRMDGVSAREVFDFLAYPSDRKYQQWWPGVHLRFHTRSRASGRAGDVVFLDEYVGTRRLRFSAVVVEAVPAARLVWQIKLGVRLPVWLSLVFADDANGVTIAHTIRAGWADSRKLFDPIFRLYLSPAFAAALDSHVRTEFRLLHDRLRPSSTARIRAS